MSIYNFIKSYLENKKNLYYILTNIFDNIGNNSNVSII